MALAALLLSACGTNQERRAEAGGDKLPYPAAMRVDTVDTYHGTKVPDPYRWLEDTSSPSTQGFIDAQNTFSQPRLEAIPARAQIKQRLTELWNYERYTVPIKRGDRYFYMRNDGLQDQSVIYVASAMDDPAPRVLIDPNGLSTDGTVAIAELIPSPDGRLLAYSLSDGSDWRVWRVRDVASGADLPDTLRYMKFREVAWSRDSRILYYSRYPQRTDGTGDDSKQMSVYRHTLGTQQSEDVEVYAITDHPTRYPYPQVTDDGRYLVLNVYDGSQSTGIHYQRLDEQGLPTGSVVKLVNSFDAFYELIGEIDDVFYVRTNAGAPTGQVVAFTSGSVDVGSARKVIGARQFALVDARLAGRRLVTQYLQNAYSTLYVHGLDGAQLYAVTLPGFGQVEDISADLDDAQAFFAYSDFLTPTSINALDVRNGKANVVRAPKLANAQPRDYTTEQVFYESKDRTRVSMFITRKKGFIKNAQAPVMLYGYGGFNIAQQPSFSVPVLVWLEMGGAYAVANLRGGSEYGEAWHEAGTKLRKQNVFDDFIYAAKYLFERKYTTPQRLAIRGRSNGGLLIGAVITQAPEMFAAALPTVGVLDMLRYQTASANARQWSDDYGLSENKQEFEALFAYSPVHRVERGACYPPTLVSTGQRDDRVVPWHSYKFAAALQFAQGCPNPILLRVETSGGHRDGKPVRLQIEEFADQLAFAAQALGM
jgi:prolyl oligopeptidase